MLLYGRFFSFCHLYLEKKIDNTVFNWSHKAKNLLILDFYTLGVFLHVKGRSWS